MLYLRKATHDDIAVIDSMLQHGIRSKMHQGDLAWGEKGINRDELQTVVAGGNIYIAHSESNNIVSICMIFWEDPARWGKQPPVAGYLHRFVVAPGHSGQDMGGQVLDLICQEVLDNGRHYLRLTCPAQNTKLQQYHLAHGFVRADSKAAPAAAIYNITYFERPLHESKPEAPSRDRHRRGIVAKLHRHFRQQYD